LVVDSDPAIHRLLGILLEGEHCRVISARTAQEGLSRASSVSPDLVILELELPGCGGLAVLRTLYECRRYPVLMVSSRASVDDKVKALDAGACDLVMKPFNGAEIAARVRVQLRTSRPRGATLVLCGLDSSGPSARQVFVNGIKLELTAKEGAVLQILAIQPGELVTNQSLMQSIWGSQGAAQLHELRVYVTRLRRKLEACGAANLIETEFNLGYGLSTGARREHLPTTPLS